MKKPKNWKQVYFFPDSAIVFIPSFFFLSLVMSIAKFLGDDVFGGVIFIFGGCLICLMSEFWMPKTPIKVELDTKQIEFTWKILFYFKRKKFIELNSISSIKFNWVLTKSTKYYLLKIIEPNGRFHDIYFHALSERKLLGKTSAMMPMAAGRIFVELKRLISLP